MIRAAVVSAVVAATFPLVVALTPLPWDLLQPCAGTTRLVDAQGRQLAALASPAARAQRPIPLAEMRRLAEVTVALEDARFYAHRGIDLRASAAALLRNLHAGRIVSGGSTITQQLIKLASGRTRRSWRAKLYESCAALRLEREWPKVRILEAYLNRSHYGNREVGPAAAAAAYFRKTPASLTLPEAIFLAGLPQSPTRYNPWRQPARAAARYQRSLAQLGRVQFLPPERLAAMTAPPAVAARTIEKRLAPHFVDAVLSEHPQLPGGTLATTLDLDLQRFVEGELDAHLARLAARKVRHGAVIVMDAATGAVRAMAGSRSFTAPGDGQINGTLAFRSCGSTLKPFLYLRAIEGRVLTAATLLPDTPDAVRSEYIDYDPVNYDRRFLGPVRVREALADSLNVPAVVTLSRVGARPAFLSLQDDGLHFARPFSEYGAGLILGNAEIRLIDLVSAFSVFAGHGLAVEPRLLAASPPRHRFVASAEAVAIVGDILCDNEARRHTFGPFSPLAFEDQRIPCKTGTSSGFRDAWAVGTTAGHTVGVWVGNFDGQPMVEIASVTGAAPIWRAIVDHLLQQGDRGVPAPVESARLVRREVCALTGSRPNACSPATVAEWFLAGTEPADDGRRFWKIEDGKPRLVLPREYAVWCRSGQNSLRAEVAADAPLRIVSPAANARYSLDPHLARTQQALRLAAASRAAEELVWRVDGEVIPAPRGEAFWPLAAGRHTASVSSGAGSASVDFTVD